MLNYTGYKLLPTHLSGVTILDSHHDTNKNTRIKKRCKVLKIIATIFIALTIYIMYWSNLLGTSRTKRLHTNFKQKGRPRLTAITTWNGSGERDYLHQFFHSVQLNDDVLDVIILNKDDGSGCLNIKSIFSGLSQQPTNIKHFCIPEIEWFRHHTDFFCRNWHCSEREYVQVYDKLQSSLRKDRKNIFFRVFLPYIFDNFITGDIQYWAWMDMDMTIGRLSSFPFEVLSSVSFFTSSTGHYQFLHGQLGAFNMQDEKLQTAFLRQAEYSTAQAFLEANITVFGEEKYWSKAYLRSDVNSAGHELSWVMLPYSVFSDSQVKSFGKFAISGKDVLLLEDWIDRQDIEEILSLQRNTKGLHYGMQGWQWSSRSRQTYSLHDLFPQGVEQGVYHGGMIEAVQFQFGEVCRPRAWLPGDFAQCFPKDSLEVTRRPIMQPSYYRSTQFSPGVVLRRLDMTESTSGFVTGPALHYLRTKNSLQMPNFAIEEDHIMLMTTSKIEVYKQGEGRDTNLFESDVRT